MGYLSRKSLGTQRGYLISSVISSQPKADEKSLRYAELLLAVQRHVFDVSRGNPRQIVKNSPGGSNSLPICRFPVRLDVKDICGAYDGCEAIPRLLDAVRPHCRP